ncbi:hypothetical protein ACP4OV_027470 [Aristida adscensionis]
MTSPARPYRFPAPPPEEKEPATRARTRCTSQACGMCGGSAVASCVALCCCPCAVVSCLTLALVKAPFMAGRRCAVRLARSRRRGALRKARRVRDLDDERRGEPGARSAALPRRSKEWGELAAGSAALPRRSKEWGELPAGSAALPRRSKEWSELAAGSAGLPRRSKEWGELVAGSAALPRRSKEWSEPSGVLAEGRARVPSARADAAELAWAEMYQVGLWGFGRLSFSASAAAVGGDSGKDDGDDAAE